MSNEMAVAIPHLPEANEWQTIVAMAKTLAASGLVPSHARTPEAAAVIILQGRELGIGAMQALRTIYLVQGRLTLSADLMAALIYRACGDKALRVIERSADQCVIDYQRPGWAEPSRMTWTMAMAKTAGLAGKDVWKAHPDAMLYARCVSAIGHSAFQDVIMGLYTPDEAEEIATSEQPQPTPTHDAATTITVTKVVTPTARELSGQPERKPPTRPAAAPPVVADATADAKRAATEAAAVKASLVQRLVSAMKAANADPIDTAGTARLVFNVTRWGDLTPEQIEQVIDLIEDRRELRIDEHGTARLVPVAGLASLDDVPFEVATAAEG